MNLLIFVVDDEPDVEVLFRQQFRHDLRAGRFTMEFAQSAPAALQRITDADEPRGSDDRIVIWEKDGALVVYDAATFAEVKRIVAGAPRVDEAVRAFDAADIVVYPMFRPTRRRSRPGRRYHKAQLARRRPRRVAALA